MDRIRRIFRSIVQEDTPCPTCAGTGISRSGSCESCNGTGKM